MKETQKSQTTTLALGKKNYIIIALSILLLVVGFLLMSGGASQSADEFNYEMFSTRRIVVAPIVLLIGFTGVGIAIMKRFTK